MMSLLRKLRCQRLQLKVMHIYYNYCDMVQQWYIVQLFNPFRLNFFFGEKLRKMAPTRGKPKPDNGSPEKAHTRSRECGKQHKTALSKTRHMLFGESQNSNRTDRSEKGGRFE